MRTLRDLWSLEGRCAVVTGAAQGFGAAISRRLAEAGAAVVLADLNGEVVRVTAERIAAETSGRCVGRTVDIADAESVEELFEWVEASIGPPDVVVNNAGVFSNYLLAEMPVEEFARVLGVNATGTFICMRAAERSMRPRNTGAIVNIASVDAQTPSAEGLSHYTSSKHAVAGLTKSLAMELAPSGIRVNAVCPGASMTEGAVALVEAGAPGGIDLEAQWHGITERTPLGRLCDPDHVGRAVVFLASDMSAHITGALLPVDGGILVAPLEGYVAAHSGCDS